MRAPHDALFDVSVWRPALEKFGAVTHLTVALFGADGEIVCGPLPATPLYAVFDAHGYDPGLFAECAQACLAQTTERPAVIVAPPYGLAVVGTSLLLDNEIVAAAVAGYALVDFCEAAAIERLARQAGLPFRRLWQIARHQQPVPTRRLMLQGELLQVLGDTLLGESVRTRQYEELAAELTVLAAAKDEFMAVLSHELRTPLSPILSWARILQGGTDPTTVRAAAIIERNARLQVRLVDDLLELNRSIRGRVVLKLGVHDLSDVVRSAIDAFADVAQRKAVPMEFVDAPEPLVVRVDEQRLQQVFRNLLSNALKFTPTGGFITVALTKQEDRAVVQVRDTGEGIAPEFLDSAFDMFRQQEAGLRRKHAGLGIGLALVKRLTEAHGGAVTIASDGIGFGTTVTAWFPLVADVEDIPGSVASIATGRQQLHGLSILVVEDLDDARDATGETLLRHGAEVLLAKDGVAALDQIQAHRVDLVLCDLRLPQMDGFEFLLALHLLEGYADVPVIAISGLTSRADHLKTEEAGFEAHIDKPFDDTRLLQAIGAVMTRRSST